MSARADARDSLEGILINLPLMVMELAGRILAEKTSGQ
jgi:hypothetical protein